MRTRAESQEARLSAFREQAESMAARIESVISASIPGPILQSPKATYLEGYGVVFMLEVALEPPPHPFSARQTRSALEALTDERRLVVRERTMELVGQAAAELDVLEPSDSVVVVVHLLNTYPADVPDLPSQIAISVKKQDVLDLQSNVIDQEEFFSRMNIREF